MNILSCITCFTMKLRVRNLIVFYYNNYIATALDVLYFLKYPKYPVKHELFRLAGFND